MVVKDGLYIFRYKQSSDWSPQSNRDWRQLGPYLRVSLTPVHLGAGSGSAKRFAPRNIKIKNFCALFFCFTTFKCKLTVITCMPTWVNMAANNHRIYQLLLLDIQFVCLLVFILVLHYRVVCQCIFMDKKKIK